MPKTASKTAARATGERPRHHKPRSQGGRVYFSQAIADEVVARIAAGERWHAIAGKDGMPAHTTPYKWAKQRPKFAEALALAKRVGADARADKTLDIAEAATTETLGVDRMHIGTLKWHVERDTKLWAPRQEEPDLGAGRVLRIEVRQFQRAVREDGTAFMQEVLPNGEVIDLD